MISAPTPAESPVVIPLRCVAMVDAFGQFGVIPEQFAISHFGFMPASDALPIIHPENWPNRQLI
jgi:hypothetical protein